MKKSDILFSIIIPTYQRPKQLNKCLQSLIDLDYNKNMIEVIVVDNGFKYSAKEIIDQFPKIFKITPIYISEKGPANARNIGAGKASGKFLIFLDDDCELSSDFLTILEKNMIKNPDILLGCRTQNNLIHNLYSETSHMILDAVYDYYNKKSKTSFIGANLMTMSKDQFVKIGSFDKLFKTSEDREFCDRWLSKGLSIKYESQAVAYHSHRLNFLSFWTQHFKYGRGAFLFHRLRAKRRNQKIKLEKISFYSHLILFPFKNEKIFRAVILELLLIYSQVASALGLLYEFIKRKTIQIYELSFTWIEKIVRRVIFKFLGLFRLMKRQTRGYAILVYHNIISRFEYNRIPEKRWYVDEISFRHQMEYIKECCTPLSMDELYKRLNNNVSPDRLYVAITFDDGYKNNLKIAYPTLKELEVPATFFITTNYIEETQSNTDLYMNWDDLKFLSRQKDILIGAHGLTHKSVKEINNHFEEVQLNKKILEEKLDSNVNYYAYPFGTKTEVGKDIQDNVRKAGFLAAFSTLEGYNYSSDCLHSLKRIMIIGGESFDMFLSRLHCSNLLGFIKRKIFQI